MGKPKLKVVADRGLLQRPADTGMRSEQDQRVRPQITHLRINAERSLHEGRLCLRVKKRSVSMPCRRANHSSIQCRWERHDSASVLAQCLPALPSEGSMFAQQLSPHSTMGPRKYTGSHAAPARPEARCNDHPPKYRRACLPYAQTL
jgi:hypothetical protein